MPLLGTFLLVTAPILSFFTDPIVVITDPVKEQPVLTLEEAINRSNDIIGVDSIFLSGMNISNPSFQYLISDHLVIINDLKTQSDLMSDQIQFSIGPSGYLELVDFDLRELQAKIVNDGVMSLKNCLFKEGKNLTRLIQNNGGFSIVHGKFVGSPEGIIFRDAVFSKAARIIL